MIDTLLEALGSVPIIGVLRRCPPEHAPRLALAAVEGGLLAVEVTMDSERAPEQIRLLRAGLPESVVVGAGTVTSIGDVDAAVAAGAEFLVAPSFIPTVVQHALDLQVGTVPGVLTPSEVSAAVTLLTAMGAQPVCKLFPAGVLGLGYLNALREPFSDVRWICTGGIRNDDVGTFVDAGALAVGLGSSLFPAAALASGDADLVRRLAAQAVDRTTHPTKLP